MSCEVAALRFQAYANYGTWSIDFDVYLFVLFKEMHICGCILATLCRSTRVDLSLFRLKTNNSIIMVNIHKHRFL